MQIINIEIKFVLDTDFDHVKSGYLPQTSSVRIHHIIENLLTLWIQPDEHILPLRIFLENILNIDLQQRTVISYARKQFFQQKKNIPIQFYAAI
jgi:hypothetical protein